MELTATLGAGEGDVIALVGAGGKTSLALRLLAELKARGIPAVFTTTTRILEPVPGPGETLVLREDEADWVDSVREALARGPVVIAARRRLRERAAVGMEYPFPMRTHKLEGVPAEWVDRLHDSLPGAVILVEADGAKGRLLKAPAAHEPVIPSSTTLFVPIAHQDAIGRPISEEFVHRPEELARLLDVPQGAFITEAMLAAAMLHPEGGMKRCPDSARVVPVLNRREESAPQAGYRVARYLLGTWPLPAELTVALAHPEGRVRLPDRVLLAHLWAEEPVGDVVSRIAGVVLAAGESRRFGRNKLLSPWGDKTVLEQVVDVALASPLASVTVVIGCEAHLIRPLIEDRPVRVVVNEDWPQGLASSVRAGLASLAPDTEAVVFLLGDQPGITPHTVAEVVRRYYQTRKPIVAPAFQGKRGNPVLFDRSTFLELASLEGDVGGRAVIARHPHRVEVVEVSDPAVIQDIDTPSDYEKIAARFGGPLSLRPQG